MKIRKLQRPTRLIVLKSGRVPPTEFLMIPMGKYETTKGDFFLTQSNAQRIIAQLEDEGVDINMDWEHESVNGTPGRKDAAGWFNVELRSDGLWATNVKWTDDAAEALASAKVRYISPAFHVDEETMEVVSFTNCALTNRPATKKAQALVAASKTQKDSTMHKKLLAALAQHMKDNKLDHAGASKKLGLDTKKFASDGYEPSQEEMAKCAKGMGLKDGWDKDGDDEETASAADGADLEDKEVPDESDDDAPGGTEGKGKVAGSDGQTTDVPGEEKFEKLSKEFTQALVTLTGETNIKKATGVLAAMKEKAMAYDKDHAALVKLMKDRDEERKAALIQRGKDEGKLTPSTLKYWASKSCDEIEGFLSVAPVIHGEAVQEVEAGTPLATLSREDRMVTELMGRDPSELAKFVEAERNGKVAQSILATYTRPTRVQGILEKKK
jgi:phage I-like protein